MHIVSRDPGECCEQKVCPEGLPCLTIPSNVGPGFDSCDKERTLHLICVNAASDKDNQLCPIYDINNAGMEEKFLNTIIFANQGNKDFA